MIPMSSTVVAETPWYWNRIGLFDGAAKSARGEFLTRSEVLEFKKDRHIFRARDRATHAYFLHRGMAKIYDLSPNDQMTLFWFALPGEIIGPGAFNGAEYHAVNAQAICDTTVLALKKAEVEDLLLTHPTVAVNLIKVLGAGLRLLSELLVDSRSLRTEVRLARALLRLAQNCGQQSLKGVTLQVKIPHQELANMIGSCRQTVNAILRDFESNELISVDRRSITITNATSLLSYAGLSAN